MRPHYKTDANAAATFERLAARDIARAVRQMILLGLRVDAADVPTPTLDALAAMPREARFEFESFRAAEASSERAALRLLATQDAVRNQFDEAAVAARAAERATFVEARALALEAEWNEARRAQHRAQAEREAAAKFDGVTEIHNKTTKPAKRSA